ncbi:MAG: FecR family protein [Synechococcaceae cyanobacterium ELA739]
MVLAFCSRRRLRSSLPVLPSLLLAVATASAGLAGDAMVRGARAAGALPQVVAVPARPAFITPPGAAEQVATVGQLLRPDTLLRTQKPGRLQVRLADGRSFRLGGDALLRIGSRELDLQRGQIIAWVNPGRQGQGRLRIHTRVATASIEGTTVFIEATPEQIKLFSWEGNVRVSTATGQQVVLQSGEELLYRDATWQPKRRLSQQEARTRAKASLLLNQFPTPMETLPIIRRELALDDQPQ